MTSFLDDGPITEFLQEQKDQYGDVLDWTYVSHDLAAVLRKIKPMTVGKTEHIYFSDFTGYKTLNTRITAVRKNFLDVVDLQYYLPAEEE
jgi:hypothetical protein